MALPVSLATRTVTFKAEKGDGTPESGTVSFARSAVLQSGAEDLFITPYTKTATLDGAGAISVVLPVTDDGDWTPGYIYHVHILVSAWEYAFDMVLPTSGSSLDLADIIGAGAPPDPPSAYVLLNTVGQIGGPAGPLDGAGLIPSAQIPGGGGGGGAVSTVNGISPVSGNVTLAASDVGAQPVDTDLTDIAALTPGTNYYMQFVASHWAARSPAQAKTDLVLVKGDVGLGNVDNTSDATKTFAQTQITGLSTTFAGKADLISGKLDPSQVPDLAIVQFLGPVANQTAMLLLVGQQGDWTIRSDTGTVWVVTAQPSSTLGNWTQLSYPASSVVSVNTKTGVVTLVPSDIGAQPADSDLTAIAGLTPTADDVMQYKAGAWANRTIAQLTTDLAITPASIGAQPVDADLTTIAGLTATANNVIQSLSGTWSSRTPAQLKTTLALVAADLSDFATGVLLTAPPTTRSVTGVGLLSGGGSLAADRVITTRGLGLQPVDFSYLDWTWDPQLATSSGTVPTSGTVYAIKLRVRTLDPINHFYVYVGATGTTPSNVLGAVYDGTNTAVAGASASIVPATFNSVGTADFALASTFTPTTIGDWFWFAFFVNGATGPSLIRTNNSGVASIGNAGLTGTNPASPAAAIRCGSANTGRTTTMPTTIGTLTAIAQQWWVAYSG